MIGTHRKVYCHIVLAFAMCACETYPLEGDLRTVSVFGGDPGTDVAGIRILVQSVDETGQPDGKLTAHSTSGSTGSWGPVNVPAGADLMVTTRKRGHLEFRHFVPAPEGEPPASREIDLLTSSEKPGPVDPSSGVLLLVRGKGHTFVEADRVALDGTGDLADAIASGGDVLTVYEGASASAWHVDAPVVAGTHTLSFDRTGLPGIDGHPIEVVAAGGSVVHVVDVGTFGTYGASMVNTYEFEGWVQNVPLLGGSVSGDAERVKIEIYALDPTTFERRSVDPTTYELIEDPVATPLYSAPVGPGGVWGPATIPESTYIEIVTSATPIKPTFHTVHTFYEVFGKWGGADNMKEYFKASNEPLPAPPAAPAAGEPVLVLKKEPFRFLYPAVPGTGDSMLVDLDPVGPPPDPTVQVVTPITAAAPVELITLYRSVGGASFPGHLEADLGPGIAYHSFSKDGSQDASPRTTRVFDNTAATTNIHMTLATVNGRFCPLPMWYVENREVGSPLGPGCVNRPEMLTKKAIDIFFPTMPPIPDPPGSRYFEDFPLDEDVLDNSIMPEPQPLPNVMGHRADLSFDDHHSLINTAFQIDLRACPTDNPACDWEDEPYAGDLTALPFAYDDWVVEAPLVDVIAVTGMTLWYIYRYPEDNQLKTMPAQDQHDYAMVFRTDGGDIVRYDHVRLPVVRYDGSSPIAVGAGGIDPFVDPSGTLPDMLAPLETSGEWCNGAIGVTPACLCIEYSEEPHSCPAGSTWVDIQYFMPVDPSYFHFDAGQKLAKMRPELVNDGTDSDHRWLLSLYFRVYTSTNEQLSIWDMYPEGTPIKDTLRAVLGFDADPASPTFNLRDSAEVSSVAPPPPDQACTFSSNPRFRDAGIAAGPRYYDNMVWTSTLASHGDQITTDVFPVASMAPETEYNTFNCLDTRINPDASASCDGQFGDKFIANGFAWGMHRMNWKDESSHQVLSYFATESDYDPLARTTTYTNYYEIMKTGWCIVDLPDDDIVDLGSSYLYKGEIELPKYLVVTETEGPVGIIIQAAKPSDGDGDTIYDEYPPYVPENLFLPAFSSIFHGETSWNRGIGP